MNGSPAPSGWDRDLPPLTGDLPFKRAAGRPKDLEAIAELEALWEERRKLGL